jgi:hypothetical protein
MRNAAFRALGPVILPIALAAAALPSRGSQQTDPRTSRSIAAVRTAEPIKIDGILTESVWQTPGFGGFTQSDPLDGQAATEPTTVWVAFDHDNLYVAASLADSEPSQVVGRLGRRDEEVESDWFYFGVDPYRDRRSGYYFGVNPSGSIIDATLFNDESEDATWDGIWQSAARVDGGGWTVELRIPFNQLRFKRQDAYVWGVNFVRAVKRKNESDWFAWKPKEESGLVSRFADLTGLAGIAAGRRLEVSPFAVSHANFHPPEAGNPFRSGHELGANAGFDLKGGLRSNLTLDLSVNPDFGQVEVDPAVINISDQETYFQEKRPFFIEGSSIFGFGRGGPNVYRSIGWENPEFFYSRRIGRTPQGKPQTTGFYDMPDWTTILGAAEVTGKVGRDFNLGIISAFAEREYASIDEGGVRTEAEVEPFSHYGIVRGLKEFEERRGGFGFIATSVVRDLRGGPLESSLSRSALALGLDGWIFLDKRRAWALAGWAGLTTVRGSREAMTRLQLSSLHYFQRPDADWVEVDENATSLSGWAGRVYINKQKGNVVFNAALGAMSPGFEANDLGFHNRGDVINGHVEAGYQTFHPGRHFRTWKVTASYYRNYDFGWNRVGEYVYLDGKGQFLNYWTAALHLDYEPPKYSHYLTRGGPMAFYPAGATAVLGVDSDDRKPLIVKFNGSYRWHPTGGFTWAFGGGMTWKPRPNVSLSVSPSYTWRYAESPWIRSVVDPLKSSTYGVRYVLSDLRQNTLAIEIRVNWTFTPRLSLQAYLQPYIATGDFYAFKELHAARTFDFDYYGDGDSTIVYANGIYTVDPDGAAGPAAPFTFDDPDFNLKSLRGTVVLRWEYRPGSMLYFVWTQKRADYAHPGDLEFWRDLGDLFQAPGENIFMVKFSYRFDW